MRLDLHHFATISVATLLIFCSKGFAQTAAGNCVGAGSNLASARDAYAAQCALPPADCDPVNGVWYCANFNINKNSLPQLTNARQTSTQTSTQTPTGSITNDGVPRCSSGATDSDNDGWGWENQSSCRVSTSSPTNTPPNNSASRNTNAAPAPVASPTAGTLNGRPVCLTDSSDADNTGYGYENNQTCIIVNGVTATRERPLLDKRICQPWFEIHYDNYVLQNNTWSSDAVFSDNWSQCIELTGSKGNYIAKWDYNWLQRDEGNEYSVKSYPQVYYGRKTQYNQSGTVAQTGLPVKTNAMPQFRVEYDYSETGAVERNVALESFFHTSCEAEDHNKQYEMMVWVGVPSVRTPGTPVTTVTLDGQQWDVYTNPQLTWAYVAFVAKQPSTRGTLNWNSFVNWSRFKGPSFGVPAMANNTCMGAIEIGTETFWGTGTFTLNHFKVTRSN